MATFLQTSGSLRRISTLERQMSFHGVLFAFLLILTSGSTQVNAQGVAGNAAMDTTIQIPVEFSGCGASDSAFYRVSMDRLGNPLVWSLTVKDCRGTILFYHSACTCESDKFFESEEYRLSQTYRGTVRDWFARDLPERLITRMKFAPGSRIFDRANEESIYRVALDFLEGRCQLSLEAANALIEALIGRMQKESMTLVTVPNDPSDPGKPLIYVKEVRQFVPIGNW